MSIFHDVPTPSSFSLNIKTPLLSALGLSALNTIHNSRLDFDSTGVGPRGGARAVPADRTELESIFHLLHRGEIKTPFTGIEQPFRR